MERSQQRLLTIEVGPFVLNSVQGVLPSHVPAVNSVIMTHASRIQEMTLLGYPQGLLCRLFEERTALSLRTLRINSVFVETNPPTPNFILGDCNFLTDRLRRLSIADCRVDWNARLFHGLTHLRIRDLLDDNKPTLEEFFTVLKHIPAMEYLDLGYFLESSGDYGPSFPTVSPKISLPSLQTLRLWTDMDETASILSSLILPAIPKIQTRSYQSLELGDGLECFDGIIEAVCEHYRTSTESPPTQGGQLQNGLTLRSVRLRSVCRPCRFVLQAFDRVLSLDDISTKSSRQNHDPALDLNFDFDDQNWNMENELLLELFYSLPLHNLVVLQLLGAFEFDHADEWAEVFGTTQTLQFVAVGESSSSSPFFKSLVYGLQSTTIPDRSKLPFPSFPQ